LLPSIAFYLSAGLTNILLMIITIRCYKTYHHNLKTCYKTYLVNLLMIPGLIVI